MLSRKKTVNTFSEHYVYRLDLGADPFVENFQASFFYQGGERRKILEQLVHYGRFSKQPVLFSGDSGCGKKRLVQEVLEQLHGVMDCCRVDVEALVDQDALLAALADRLGLKLDQEHSLNSFISALNFTVTSEEAPDPVLIVIENIQLLEQAEVSFLMEMQQAAQGGIHLLLVANTNDTARKHSEFLQQYSLKVVALRPLSQQESAEYLQLLLQSVGYAGEFPLSESQLNSLHEAAQGNFFAMQQIMPKLLMRNELVGAADSSLGVPITHVAAIAVLASAIVVAYLYQGEEPALAELPATAAQQKAKTSPSPILSTTNEPVLSVNREQPQTLAVAASNDAKPLVSETPEEVAKDPINKAVEPQETVSNNKSQQTTDIVPPVTVAEVKPAAKSAPKPAPKLKNQHSSKEQRLLDMPSSAYMLQLLGTRKEQSAKDFSRPYQGQLSVTYISTTLKGQPWYVVLLGPYDSRDQALAAIKHLHPALQRQKPWARSLSGIQAEIRQ